MKKFPADRIWLDHFLAVLAGVMAVYSVCISVGLEQNARLLAGGAALAGLAGFGLSMLLEETKIHRADGWFLAFFGFLGLSQTRNLNEALPDGPLPFAIIAAVMMAILLIVGGIFAWRDATLLFLSLPSLVLFGLVGTIDTWRPALFLFCGMILCIALLYARVHQRTMLKWAVEGGANPKLLHRDVWRWQAGPEYAFVAAGTIILLSFVGAPVVQTSLTGVSDAVRVNVNTQLRNQTNQTSNPSTQSVDAPIGSGPVNLSDRVEAFVKIDQPRYLRRSVYDQYSTRGWRISPSLQQITPLPLRSAPSQTGSIRNGELKPEFSFPEFESVEFSYEPMTTLSTVVPTPSVVIATKKKLLGLSENMAGAVIVPSSVKESVFDFTIRVPMIEQTPTEIGNTRAVPPAMLDRYLQVPASVGQGLELNSAEFDQLSDFEKLNQIKAAIAAQNRYNTQTPAVPQGKDPVTYFLNESKEGYCDLFASAFVIEARKQGFPARYVTGYLMDSTQLGEDGRYVIREKHSHSWAEVYFEDYGWLMFDATEGAVDVTPEESEAEDQSLIGRIRAWLSENIALIVGGLAIALIAGVALQVYRRRDQSESQSGAKLLNQQTMRFQRALERTVGSPRRFSQTFREYADLHQAQLVPISSEVNEALPIIERALYGPSEISEEDSVRLSQSIAQMEITAKLVEKERKAAQKSKRKPA